MVNECIGEMKRNVNSEIEHNFCTGCGACSEKCPKKCISMKYDTSVGFRYPSVDNECCIECGVCSKTCPVLRKGLLLDNLQTLAAVSTDEKILKSANSGGIFSTIANLFIEKGGYVCGAVFTKELEVKHVIVNDKKGLAALKGSKYIQSESNECFPQIKKILVAGGKVLFAGTGCQVAGLKAYLGKDFDTLLSIEVVCHGVPSPLLFKEYLKWLGQKHGGVVTSYRFRSKKIRPTGEHSQFFCVIDNKEYIGQSLEDPFYGSFLKGKILRPSCYHCHFKGKSRVADITLGDFWGIEKYYRDFPIKNGTNVVMINSTKGLKLFGEVKKNVHSQSSTYEIACALNPSIKTSTPIPQETIDYKSPHLFDVELKPKLSFKDKVKNRIPWKLKWCIKKYL